MNKRNVSSLCRSLVFPRKVIRYFLFTVFCVHVVLYYQCYVKLIKILSLQKKQNKKKKKQEKMEEQGYAGNKIMFSTNVGVQKSWSYFYREKKKAHVT